MDELEQKLGRFDKGNVSIAAGGHLLIRPTTRQQQEDLLNTKSVLRESIEVTCSLPNTFTKQRVIIRQVPTGDTNEDILQALKTKGYKVNSVYRFNITKGTISSPSTTVALEFDGPPPQDILLNGLVFHPETQKASPLRCKRCQKLGHTSKFCNNPQVCADCGQPHDDTLGCTSPPNCVNCCEPHPSSSPNCLKYSRMRAAIQASGAKGQPLGEERNPSYSEAAKKNRLYPAQNPEAEILKSQIQAIQTEMSRFRTEIGKFKNLEKKVDELDNSVSQIKTSLSNLNKGQENSNYKLDSLIGMIQKLSGQPEAGADMEEDEEDFIPITRKEKSKIPTLTGAGLLGQEPQCESEETPGWFQLSSWDE